MLEPDSRVVLLNQLRPPAGFRVDAAVATTFTLSLSAALVPPLAFASADVSATPDPVTLLSSVRECADVVDVFCQPGQIEVPQQASDLMAFLEPMVHPVHPPRPGYLFHPKLWFLRYTNDERDVRYRLLCTSRNLVDSNAWDLAVTLDGVATDEPRDENRDLAALLRWLPANTVTPLGQRRRARINNLADAASTIRWEHPEHVEELRFHAWGVGTEPTADFHGTQHLVVAPFMDADGLRRVTPRSPDITIVSRPDALDAIDPGELRRGTNHGERVFVLDSAAELSEEDDGVIRDDIARERDGLHAKLIVVHGNYRARMFIGSPNVTGPAYDGNVEFAVELIGRYGGMGINRIVGDDAPLRPYLQQYAGPEDAVEAEDPLRGLKNALRNVAGVAMSLTVETDGDAYRLHLESRRPVPLPEGMTAAVSLLTTPGIALPIGGEPVDVAFEDVELPDITPFVVVHVTEGSETIASVVHAPLRNDPERRLDEVLARQIDTPEKFMRFLLLLLGFADGNGSWIALLDASAGESVSMGMNGEAAEWSGLLEELVQALVANPASIDRAHELVKSLKRTEQGAKVLPKGFEELWNNVLEARRRLEEVSR